MNDYAEGLIILSALLCPLAVLFFVKSLRSGLAVIYGTACPLEQKRILERLRKRNADARRNRPD